MLVLSLLFDLSLLGANCRDLVMRVTVLQFELFLAVQLGVLYPQEVFLGMGANLGAGSGCNNLLNLLPVFAVELDA